MKPSLVAFLLNEDLASDVLNIQTQISMLQKKKNDATKSIDNQLQQLQATLAQKQKQLAAQQRTQPKQTTPPAQPTAQAQPQAPGVAPNGQPNQGVQQ